MFEINPACGSGTILVSAYKRKRDLYEQEGFIGNPHKRFCEHEIFGSDIMPFAVHLTTANLATMDTSSTIDRTQIIRGDSLKLSEGYMYKTGAQLTLFPTARKGYSIKGEDSEIDLEKVNVVLMNPPFTKIERGIREYIDMNRFHLASRSMGIDPAWGSSAFGIVVTQWADGIVEIMHAEEYTRPDYNEMLSTVYSLMSKYNVDKVYIDGANPSFIKSLKLQIGEDQYYDKVIARYRSEKLGDNWSQDMRIVPVKYLH
jgi:hypothetical protein